MGYDTLVSVKKSEKAGKDYTATFRDSKTGKEKKTHFGEVIWITTIFIKIRKKRRYV